MYDQKSPMGILNCFDHVGSHIRKCIFIKENISWPQNSPSLVLNVTVQFRKYFLKDLQYVGFSKLYGIDQKHTFEHSWMIFLLEWVCLHFDVRCLFWYRWIWMTPPHRMLFQPSIDAQIACVNTSDDMEEISISHVWKLPTKAIGDVNIWYFWQLVKIFGFPLVHSLW